MLSESARERRLATSADARAIGTSAHRCTGFFGASSPSRLARRRTERRRPALAPQTAHNVAEGVGEGFCVSDDQRPRTPVVGTICRRCDASSPLSGSCPRRRTRSSRTFSAGIDHSRSPTARYRGRGSNLTESLVTSSRPAATSSPVLYLTACWTAGSPTLALLPGMAPTTRLYRTRRQPYARERRTPRADERTSGTYASVKSPGAQRAVSRLSKVPRAVSSRVWTSTVSVRRSVRGVNVWTAPAITPSATASCCMRS